MINKVEISSSHIDVKNRVLNISIDDNRVVLYFTMHEERPDGYAGDYIEVMTVEKLDLLNAISMLSKG
jgi:hypothetical protein